MEIIELYLRQEIKNSNIYEGNLMKEYFNLCRFLHKQQISDEDLISIIEDKIKSIDRDVRDILHRTSLQIREEFDSIIPNLNTLFPSVNIKGIILLIGEGNIDGHGRLVDGEPYVVIDLLTLASSIDIYDLETFLIHETVHAIHYYLNPQMYFSNYRSIEDQYFKRLVTEGLATFVSGKFVKDEMEYWLGFFNPSQTNNWKNNCEVQLDDISKKLSTAISNDKVDEDLYYELFSVTDPDQLESSRLAYYYGSEICSKNIREQSFEELLKTEEDKWIQIASKYFNITK